MIGVYACKGMQFYAELARAHLGFSKYHPDKPALFLGMYFKEDVEALTAHKGPAFVYWNGSDVTRTLANPAWHEPIVRKGAVHATHTEALKDELKAVGLTEVEVSPTLFGDVRDYKPVFKPAPPNEPTRLFMTVHPGREEEYGLSMLADLMRYLANVRLYVYGNDGGARRLDNIIFRGVVNPEVWNAETAVMQAAVRANKHDGMSQIVMKAILRGQYAIVTPRPWELFRGILDVGGFEFPNTATIPNLNGWITRIREASK